MSQAIFITGASSGIGRALAIELASRGYRLALAARRAGLLAELADEIRAGRPETAVTVHPLDVTDYDAVPAALAAAANGLGGLDIVFANAGLGHGERIGDGHFAATRETIEVNVLGAMATVDAAVAHFRRQGRGYVVGNASMAAFRGLPGNAAYSASKVALATYLEGLRAELVGTKIDVTVLYPGYIDTPINNMIPTRPFVISVEKGARIIADILERRPKSAIVPRWPWIVVRYLMPRLPTRLVARLA